MGSVHCVTESTMWFPRWATT